MALLAPGLLLLALGVSLWLGIGAQLDAAQRLRKSTTWALWNVVAGGDAVRKEQLELLWRPTVPAGWKEGAKPSTY